MQFTSAADNRAIIAQTLGRSDAIRARLQELRDGPHGGSWLATNQDTLARLPTSIYANLKQRAAKNNGVIREERQLTADEKANLEVMRTGLASASGHGFDDWKKVGELLGLGAVKQSVREAFQDVESHLQTLEATADRLPVKDYRRWANWCKSIDGRLREIELLILEGRRFFTESNLVQLRLLPMDNPARSRLASFRFVYYEESGERAA